MLSLLMNRRSIRKFRNAPIPKDMLDSIISAALLSPSSKNLQPLEFIVTEDRNIMAQLEKCKSPGSIALATSAAAIAVIGDTEKSDVWIEDASIASIIIQLQAEKLGLGSCWIQMRNRNGESEASEPAVRKVLNIPENYGVLAVIALGYKDEKKKPYTEEDLNFNKIHKDRF